MKLPKIKGVEFLSVHLNFKVPIDVNLYDLGGIYLSRGERKFNLDTILSFTSFDYISMVCKLEVDLDWCPKDELCQYDLTIEDLMSDDLNASMYIGEEWEEEPQSITLFVRLNKTTTKAIELKID
jgi:hypothetical protein